MGRSAFKRMEGDTEEGDHAHLLPTLSSTSGYSQDVSDSKAPGPKGELGGSVSLQASAALGGTADLKPIYSDTMIYRRPDAPYSEAELEQTDAMINHMIVSYVSCLCLGWGLLFFDWAWNEVEKHPKAEPWISNAVTIGGASAVLSPIIQWGHAVMYSPSAATEVARMRRRFYQTMWLLYVAIVGISTLVAIIRYAIGDDGSLHHFISMTSNHLVLARISALLINWVSGKLFIKWYRSRLATGPLF